MNHHKTNQATTTKQQFTAQVQVDDQSTLPRHTVDSLHPVGMTSRTPLLKLDQESPGDGGGHTQVAALDSLRIAWVLVQAGVHLTKQTWLPIQKASRRESNLERETKSRSRGVGSTKRASKAT